MAKAEEKNYTEEHPAAVFVNIRQREYQSLHCPPVSLSRNFRFHSASHLPHLNLDTCAPTLIRLPFLTPSMLSIDPNNLPLPALLFLSSLALCLFAVSDSPFHPPLNIPSGNVYSMILDYKMRKLFYYSLSYPTLFTNIYVCFPSHLNFPTLLTMILDSSPASRLRYIQRCLDSFDQRWIDIEMSLIALAVPSSRCHNSIRRIRLFSRHLIDGISLAFENRRKRRRHEMWNQNGRR